MPHAIKPRCVDPSNTDEDLTCDICKKGPPECFSRFYQCQSCNEIGLICQISKPDFTKVIVETPLFKPSACTENVEANPLD